MLPDLWKGPGGADLPYPLQTAQNQCKPIFSSLHFWNFEAKGPHTPLGFAPTHFVSKLCFYRQKLLSPILIGQSKSPGSFGLAQQVFI